MINYLCTIVSIQNLLVSKSINISRELSIQVLKRENLNCFMVNDSVYYLHINGNELFVYRCVLVEKWIFISLNLITSPTVFLLQALKRDDLTCFMVNACVYLFLKGVWERFTSVSMRPVNKQKQIPYIYSPNAQHFYIAPVLTFFHIISGMRGPGGKFRVDLTVLPRGMQHTSGRRVGANDISANIVSVTGVNKDWEHLKLAPPALWRQGYLSWNLLMTDYEEKEQNPVNSQNHTATKKGGE